jgi:hypothetical protein
MKHYAALFLLLLPLQSCLSQRTADTLKSHAVETGIAAGAGALAVATGGAAAIPIFLGGMGTAAFVGELEKPAPQVEHTTTVIDEKGKILSEKTTTTAKKTPTEATMEFLTTRNLIVLALLVIALLFPGARAVAAQALAGAIQAAKAGAVWVGAHLKSLRTQKRPEKPVKPMVKRADDPFTPPT